MTDVTYVKGTGENLIHIMDWTPGSDTVPGTVVVIGDTPCVSMAISRNGFSALSGVQSSIRVRGGAYSGILSGSVTGRKKVYWDNTAKKFTLVATNPNKHFGFTAPDTNNSDGDTITVEHDPDGSPDNVGATNTVAATGSTQADAAPLTSGTNYVTGANAAKGVLLPVPVDGMPVTIINDDTANAVLLVYPTTGLAINGLAANGAISMAAKSSATFRYFASQSKWSTTPKVPS